MERDIAAVPWYTSEQHYQQFRMSALDHSDFFDSYNEWSDVAMEHERQAELRGITLFRIRMPFEAFLAWCVEKGCQNDSVGRATFANELANKLLDLY